MYFKHLYIVSGRLPEIKKQLYYYYLYNLGNDNIKLYKTKKSA